MDSVHNGSFHRLLRETRFSRECRKLQGVADTEVAERIADGCRRPTGPVPPSSLHPLASLHPAASCVTSLPTLDPPSLQRLPLLQCYHLHPQSLSPLELVARVCSVLFGCAPLSILPLRSFRWKNALLWINVFADRFYFIWITLSAPSCYDFSIFRRIYGDSEARMLAFLTHRRQETL